MDEHAALPAVPVRRRQSNEEIAALDQDFLGAGRQILLVVEAGNGRFFNTLGCKEFIRSIVRALAGSSSDFHHRPFIGSIGWRTALQYETASNLAFLAKRRRGNPWTCRNS